MGPTWPVRALGHIAATDLNIMFTVAPYFN
jgi:hypothetical protein